jgi:hypothetical protein
VLRLLLVILFISLSSIVFTLQAVSLLGPKFIVQAPNLLFCSAYSCVARHIRPSPDISDLRLDISGSVVLTGLN